MSARPTNRNAGEREILFDLDKAIAGLNAEQSEIEMRLSKLRSNLIRRRMED